MRKTKITTIILAIILVTLVAFGGVYIKTQNRMENKVADYNLSRELEGQRVVEMERNSSKEELVIENCEIVKNTMENRLNDFGAQDYTISLNEKDGTIRIELPENVDTDAYVSLLGTSVQVQIKEKDADVELLNDSMVKNAKYTYTSNIEGAYQVFLELYLTDEGQAKIEEIKNNYAILVDEVEENETAETEKKDGEDNKETEETKKIAKLTIGESDYSIDRIENGKLRVVIGSETTNTSYVDSYINSAAQLAILINSGKYPVEYKVVENRYEYSDITNTEILYFIIALAIVLVISFVVLTIKYKTKGLLASISYIGFVSILTLILRYTDVNISIEGIGAIILVLIINLIINKQILKNTKNAREAIIDVYKDTFFKLVPVIIITLVFCFAGVANLSSFGMIMFWGLALIAGYNVTITKALLKLKESK